MGACSPKKKDVVVPDAFIAVSPSQFIKETKGNFYASYRIGNLLGKGASTLTDTRRVLR